MSRRRKILVADLLCGAGGSSTGCTRALAELGLEMELVCVNHWPVAIETHSRNHPRARHYCQDIASVRPHRVVPEGYLDLLMASPSCTHHSVARGGKPTSDQQRSDPWHILTWFTELRVKRAIIENVWEYTGWGPVDRRSGKPVKSRKGEYFDAWVDSIRRIGATSIEYRKLNAADYGDATTRQRFIMKIRFDRIAIGWAPLTHARRADDVILLPSLKPWRPAREIIDWSIRGKSIFNRRKPLAPKTLVRIHAGAVKFNWPEPFLVILRNHMAGQSVDGPLPTIAANGTHIALAQPVIISPRHGKDGAGPRPRAACEPLPTITAGGSQFAVAEPVITNGRKNNKARGVSAEPVPTLDTKGGVWLAEPFILNRHGDGYGEARAHSVAAPAPTANCDGGGYLVEPFLLSRHGDGAPRSIAEPTPTQVAKHSHCLISPYYGHGWQHQAGGVGTCLSADQPLPTVTSKARFGMVFPITHSDGSNRARDVETDPLPTLTTAHRGEQALVEGTAEYDILFRMLEPHELAAAMGFDGEDSKYEFAGTKTEQIKQIGNAVSVAMMKAEVKAIMADVAMSRVPAGVARKVATA